MGFVTNIADKGPVVFAFVSSVSEGVIPAQIVRLVRQSSSANPNHGITGILMFRNGRFHGINEGSNHEVQRLAARIIADERHCNISVTRFESIEKRQFEGWRIIGFEQFLDDLPGDALADTEDVDKIVPLYFEPFND